MDQVSNSEGHCDLVKNQLTVLDFLPRMLPAEDLLLDN